MERYTSQTAGVHINVRLRYRKDRSAWQMSYRDPATGRLVSKLAGAVQSDAVNAVETWQAELNEKEWPDRTVAQPRGYSNRRPVTAEEFERMIGAVPIVVGAEYSASWIKFLRALRSGIKLQAAFQLHSLKHELLTMSLANVQRVITQIGRAAKIQGKAVTSQQILGDIK